MKKERTIINTEVEIKNFFKTNLLNIHNLVERLLKSLDDIDKSTYNIEMILNDGTKVNWNLNSIVEIKKIYVDLLKKDINAVEAYTHKLILN